MIDSVIAIQHLRVQAGRSTLLQLDELRIEAGEVFGLIGPNGAGKSTLLRTLIGRQGIAAGSVSVLGQRLDQLDRTGKTRLRRRIGYVPQSLQSRPELPLTVREVVAIGRSGLSGLFRPLRRSDWQIVDEWIERFGLAELRHRAYGDCSGGEQRKTLIAQAMVQQPSLLLLDEPTAYLDLGRREQIVQTLDELYAETKLTILLVCHELEVLPQSCRRLAILDRGQLIATGEPTQVLTDERIASLYGPGLSIHHVGGRHMVIPAAGVSHV